MNKNYRRVVSLSLTIGMISGVTGCGTSPQRADSTLPPQATTTTTIVPTTTTIDPAIIPDQITLPYVQVVVNQLATIDSQAQRMSYAAHVPTPTVLTYLKAIYTQTNYQIFVNLMAQSVNPRNYPELKDPPGDSIQTVTNLETATPSCIFAAETTDTSQVFVNSKPPFKDWLWLVPKTQADDPQNLNHTAWQIEDDIVEPINPNATPPDKCAG